MTFIVMYLAIRRRDRDQAAQCAYESCLLTATSAQIAAKGSEQAQSAEKLMTQKRAECWEITDRYLSRLLTLLYSDLPHQTTEKCSEWARKRQQRPVVPEDPE